MVEHVVQVIQKFLLGFEKAHGLLGAAFDFEWVHFVYNTLLEPALILSSSGAAAAGYRPPAIGGATGRGVATGVPRGRARCEVGPPGFEPGTGAL